MVSWQLLFPGSTEKGGGMSITSPNMRADSIGTSTDKICAIIHHLSLSLSFSSFLCLRKKEKEKTHTLKHTDECRWLQYYIRYMSTAWTGGNAFQVPQSTPKKSQIVYHIIWYTSINKKRKRKNGAQMWMKVVFLQHTMACMLTRSRRKETLFDLGSIFSARIDWP